MISSGMIILIDFGAYNTIGLVSSTKTPMRSYRVGGHGTLVPRHYLNCPIFVPSVAGFTFVCCILAAFIGY